MGWFSGKLSKDGKLEEMSVRPKGSFKHSEWLYGLLLYILIGVVFWIYHYSFHAPWFYDDRPNLVGLLTATDFKSSFDFVVSGIASALGRPISNLSFLLNVGDLPSNPSGFRYVGTLLHILNGLLLYWAAFILAGFLPALAPRARLFALILTAVWLLHPIQFTATLMPVQRMTVLAGTFTMLGILSYAFGRRELATGSWPKALVILTVSVGSCTLLGTLAKENGALLPLLLASLELLVLRRIPVKSPPTIWLAWRVLFFVLPALLLVAYMLLHWNEIIHTYAIRPFAFDERLGAEVFILLDYLRLIFFPDVRVLGPFQDDVLGISFFSAKVILALSLIAALIAVLAFFYKKTWPILFALSWFIVGHLLESTVWPLELYFEHRNYIPSLAPLAVLVGCCMATPILRGAVCAYIVLLSAILWSISFSWANPLLAAEMYESYREKSARAALFLANQYDALGQYDVSMRILKRASIRMPQDATVALSYLFSACREESEADVKQALSQLMEKGADYHHSHSLRDLLGQIAGRLDVGSCSGMTQAGMIDLTKSLLDSPYLMASSSSSSVLLVAQSRAYRASGDLSSSIASAQMAYEGRRSSENALFLAALFLENNDLPQAVGVLEDYERNVPSGDVDVSILKGKLCSKAPDLCG